MGMEISSPKAKAREELRRELDEAESVEEKKDKMRKTHES